MVEIKDFICNAATIVINAENKSCIISFDLDDWENPRDAIKDIDLFVEGNNDMIAEDIDNKFEEMGFTLVFPGHVQNDGDVYFDLEEI